MTIFYFDIKAVTEISKRRGGYRVVTIPLLKIVKRYKLESKLQSYGYLYSYQIMDHDAHLILTIPALTTPEISELHQFFEMKVMIQHFIDLRVWHSDIQGGYIMKLDSRVIQHLNAGYDILWSKFEVGKKTYFMLSGDAKLPIEI